MMHFRLHVCFIWYLILSISIQIYGNNLCYIKVTSCYDPQRSTMLIFRVQVYRIFREISSISYSRDSKYDLRMN